LFPSLDGLSGSDGSVSDVAQKLREVIEALQRLLAARDEQVPPRRRRSTATTARRRRTAATERYGDTMACSDFDRIFKASRITDGNFQRCSECARTSSAD
jgi:hypothetical protein